MSHPVWVRGLKHCKVVFAITSVVVAPRVGAWIETVVETPSTLDNTSHPVWVRGLKLLVLYPAASVLTSHPVWVRGLKLSLLIC